MSKRKILITVLVFLLMVLVVYLFMISSVNEKKPEESVIYPYTNWMSKPDKENNKQINDDGIIVFKQE